MHQLGIVQGVYQPENLTAALFTMLYIGLVDFRAEWTTIAKTTTKRLKKLGQLCDVPFMMTGFLSTKASDVATPATLSPEA